MKKIIFHLAGVLLLLSGMAAAQTKAPADAAAKPKTSAIGQQINALVKAITDSLSAQNPKGSAKKTTYGIVTLTPNKIIVYDDGNKDTLLNPNLTDPQLKKIREKTSNLTDEQKFLYLQIDTAEVTFKKNKIAAIRIVSTTAGVAALVKEIDPWDIKATDVISITVGNKHGSIRVAGFLTFLWLAAADDNLESGVKKLNKTSLSVPITSY